MTIGAVTQPVLRSASSQTAFCPRLFQAPPRQLCDRTSDRHTTCSLDRYRISFERDRRHSLVCPEQGFHFPRKVSPQPQPPPSESSPRFSTIPNPREQGRITFHPRRRTRARQIESSRSVDP